MANEYSSALETLKAAYAKALGDYYTPRTDAELQERAQGEYASLYSAKNRAAQQEYETTDLALQQQLAGLQRTYDKQRQSSQEQYRNAYSQADRGLLQRGMQRSSYGAQTLANINMKGAEALQQIYDSQAAEENNINEQRALKSSQLASTLAGLTEEQAMDVLNRTRELQDEENTRKANAAQLSAELAGQLYGYQFQEDRARTQDSQWQQEFNAAYGNKGSSGGGGGGRKKTGNSDANRLYQYVSQQSGDIATGISNWLKGR